MSGSRNLEEIEAFMEDLLERKGTATPLGVGWPNRENQQTRFAQLLRLIDDDGEEFTVNDLGCGFADLYSFIRANRLPMKAYRGYDLSEKMLAAARERVGPDAELIRSDHLTERADYSFACGIFNTRLEATDEEWLAYMKSVVLDLHRHSNRGFAFNSFSTYVDWREPHLFYADPMELFRYCKEEVSPRVALLHDYPLWEWTIMVRRVDPASEADRGEARDSESNA
jgi:SAM-dependent methyltransferase